MKKNKIVMTKEKMFNIMIVLIVIVLYIFAGMFLYTNFRERKRTEIANNIIDKIDDQIEENKEEEINFNDGQSTSFETSYQGQNYTVLGKIKISKINIYQPILKENTKDSYNVSVVKMSGPTLNTYGNVAIGGHNYMKGNFFIKINKLVNNDVIEVTDLLGVTIKYYVYEYGVTSIDDVSYLKQPSDETVKMITLVTCTKGGKERYYVKAKAK